MKSDVLFMHKVTKESLWKQEFWEDNTYWEKTISFKTEYLWHTGNRVTEVRLPNGCPKLLTFTSVVTKAVATPPSCFTFWLAYRGITTNALAPEKSWIFAESINDRDNTQPMWLGSFQPSLQSGSFLFFSFCGAIGYNYAQTKQSVRRVGGKRNYL